MAITKIVHARIGRHGELLTTTGPMGDASEISVTDVPEHLPTSHVIAALSRVAFVPWPKAVSWSVLRGKRRFYRPRDCRALAAEGRMRL